MNKRFIIFFSVIFTMNIVKCAYKDSNQVDSKKLTQAIVESRGADYYSNDRVQLFTAGYVSSQELNRKFIEETIAPSLQKRSDEINRNFILFCSSKSADGSSKRMAYECYDIIKKQWQDVSFESMEKTDPSLLIMYVIPSGKEISLEQHNNVLAFFITRGDSIVICFEKDSALNIICELAWAMLYRVRQLVGVKPLLQDGRSQEEGLLSLDNLWEHNINGFRDNIIYGAVLIIGIPLALYVASRVFKH